MELRSMQFSLKDVMERLSAEQIQTAGEANIVSWVREVAKDEGNGLFNYQYLKFPAASEEESFMAWLFYPVDVPRDPDTEMIGKSHFPMKIKVGKLREPRETLGRLALACTLKNPYACKAMVKFFDEEKDSYKKKVKAYEQYMEEGKEIENEVWNPYYPLALFGLGALTGAAAYGLATAPRRHHHHYYPPPSYYGPYPGYWY